MARYKPASRSSRQVTLTSTTNRLRALATSFVLLGGAACTGQIGSPTHGEEAGQGGGDSDAAPEPTDLGTGEFSTSPGLRRLTRVEYRNTIRSLFDIDVETDELGAELLVKGHSQISGAQKTGYDDVDRYFELGADVAATAAPSMWTQSGCEDSICLRGPVESFLNRAFRREITADVLDDYVAILESDESGETPTDRLETLLAAALSSPHFLYRREVGQPIEGSTWRSLDDYEIASRMSYTVWQTTPDAELLEAARAGRLSDPPGRIEQLERMLQSDLAPQGARAFVFDWLGVFDNRIGDKAPAVLEGTSPDLPQDAARSLELLVDEVLFSGLEEGRLVELLRTNIVYANAELAALIGVEGGDEELRALEVDAQRRRGVLTHPLVIAAHSKEGGASPFPIGKFVYENMLCETIPPPPPSIPTVEEQAEGQTLRQQLETVTSSPECLGCHIRIGPPGFAFLPFDPLGRYIPTDKAGRPWDTAGELVLSGADETIPFSDVSDLSMVLADSDAVSYCASRRLFRWAYGRFEREGADNETIAALRVVSEESDTSTFELLRAIVGDARFAQVLVK